VCDRPSDEAEEAEFGSVASEMGWQLHVTSHKFLENNCV
jgi:hypothetical protein